MSILLKAVYRFSAIPMKNTSSVFSQTYKTIPKFVWKYKRPGLAKVFLNKNKTGGIAIPDMKK